MSLSQSLSSSTSLHKIPGHNDSDTKINNDDTTDSFLSLPAMKTRKHVLGGMPDDIKRYWLYNFILYWDASRPADIAKALHHMATISKVHQQEVIELVQNEPDIAMDYTAHAMRGLAEMAIVLSPKDKSRARRELMVRPEGVVSDNDVDVYNFRKKVNLFVKLYPTATINLSTNERKEFNHPEWVRAALQEFLNPALDSKRVRFDFSVQRQILAPLQNRNSIFSKKSLTEIVYLPREIDDVRGSPIRIISELITKFKKNHKQIYAGPIIELIIKNNLAALHELGELPIELNIALIDASGARTRPQSISQTFSRNNLPLFITCFDIEPLATYLANKSCRLTTLNLHDCTLDASALVVLAEGLEENTSINMLDLSKNLLRHPGISGPDAYDGLTKFSCILAASSSLLHLNLANCSLRDEGATILHEALKMNSHLQILNLSENMIHHDHAIWSDTRVIGRSVPQVN